MCSITQVTYAQLFEGSNGDGFALAESIKNTLAGQSITVLFNGSNGDGFAVAESIKNTLGKTNANRCRIKFSISKFTWEYFNISQTGTTTNV